MAVLSEITPITRLQDNVRTGNVLVRFDPRTVDMKTVETDIDAAAERVVGKAAKQVLRGPDYSDYVTNGKPFRRAVCRPLK